MLTSLKAVLYQWFTRNHILYYAAHVPGLKQLLMIMLFGRMGKDKEFITDEGGATMVVSRFDGRTFPAFGKQRLSTIKDITIRKDDVLLCGYPKTGCHWVYEILFMMRNQKAALSHFGKGFGGMMDAMPDIVLDSLPSPRVMNSHMLYDYLPPSIADHGNKIVLTIRSPKDTVVSYFNHTKNLDYFYHYNGEFHNYCKMFIKGELDYGSYFDFYQSWAKVMKTQKNNKIFLLKFEDLKKDTLKVVKDLAEFLEISISDQLAEAIVETSKFSNMKSKRPKNKIFRKGEVGDWTNWLTDEQAAEIDALWNEKMVDFH